MVELSNDQLAVPSGQVSIVVNGRSIPAQLGETVAGALMKAGIRSWRTTRRRNRPRGLFCGIGVCFDCLLTVDGLADQRACLIPVQAGLVIRIDEPGADEGPARVKKGMTDD